MTEYVSITVATEMLGRQSQYVYLRVRDGRLPAVRGKKNKWLVDKNAVLELMAAKHGAFVPKPLVTRAFLVQLAHMCQRCSLNYNDPDMILGCKDVGESCWELCPACHPNDYVHLLPVRR